MHQGFKTALGAAAVVCTLAAPAAASAATLTVDDDRQQCRKAEFTSINAAIQAAAPGDEVRVCAGAYPEQVKVDKPIELRGPNRGTATDPARLGPPDPQREAIVVNTGTAGVDVIASDVEVSGLRVQGTGTNPYPGAGIRLDDGTDREIRGNVLDSNNLGLHLNGAQTGVDIERNTIVRSNDANPGSPSGALFNDEGLQSDVAVVHNALADNGASPAFNDFGLNFGQPSTGLVVEHNTSQRDATFVIIGNSNRARIEHNDVEESRANGVNPFGDNVDLRIAHNRLDGSAVSNFGIAVRARRSGTEGGNPGLVVEHNAITQFFDGISVDQSFGGQPVDGADAEVDHNRVFGNDRHGIRLFSAIGVTVAFNQADDNAENGIRVDETSRENVLLKNSAFGNAVDCVDTSNGARTAGTANTWDDNRGETDNRGGQLCAQSRGR